MSHYTNHSVVIQDDADTTPTIIGSLSQVETPIENDVQYSDTAGSYFPENVSIAGIKPSATFTTFDLPKVLAALGLIGRSVVEGTSKPGFAIMQAKYNDSAISPGATHRRLRMPKAYIKSGRISVSHQQDATIDVEAMSIYDLASQPVLIEEGQALPSLPSNPGRWTLGAITIGGIHLKCNVNLDIDFGVSASAFGCDSDLYDSHLNLDSVQPKISITSLDPTRFAAAVVPLIGKQATHANTSIYLRKRLDGQAGYVADATTEHIKLTAEGILNVTNAHGASGNQRAQTTLQLSTRFDGTNAPIIFNTESAIT